MSHPGDLIVRSKRVGNIFTGLAAAALLVMVALAVTGCGDNSPECPADSAKKAAAAFEQCLLMEQIGSGGWSCGKQAYQTFCKAE